MFRSRLPQVPTQVDFAVLDGGLDMISPPGSARPGTCRFAVNYETEFGGGYRRIGGYERIDGRPAPSRAEYVVLEAEAGFTITVGATVEGSVSGAEGKVIWVSPDFTQIGLTRLLPGFVFEEGEEILLASTPRGLITNASPVIDSFLDNDLAYLAAEEYRQFIQQPPGAGPIRGVAVLANQLYCWRDTADNSAKKIFKATASGWSEVNLGLLVIFEEGDTIYADGGSLTQGSVSAIIRRVVVTEGEWGAAVPTDRAKGYFIIDAPIGGDFVAGAATGTGACVLMGPQTPITIPPGGRVETVVYNFFGSTDTKRIYGCDGVAKEFEFDGTVYVPLETGMGTIRAQHVAAHKNHLFFAFRGSMQHSGVGEPHKWSPLFGAGELAIGDIITGFASAPGSEQNAALMVTGRDTVHVLYGSDNTSWQLIKLADEAGAQRYSLQLMEGLLAFDRDGFNRYSPTDVFGNFSYQSASRAIEPLVKNSSVTCSVLAKDKSKYRCFFADGSFVTGTPIKSGIAWMPGDYGRVINVAVGGEIAGQYRIFMGDSDGWVLEADVGRSFDGEMINAGLRLSSMNQRSNISIKQYRQCMLQSQASSAYALAAGAEFSDSNPEQAMVTESNLLDFKKQYGVGLFWDFNAWDQAYWDGAAANDVRYDTRGIGQSISLLFSSASDRELPHTLKTVTVTYTTRRLSR